MPAVLMSLAHPGLCGLPRLLRHRLSAAALLLLLLHTATATATATAEEEVEAEKELPSRWWPEVEGRAKRSYLTDEVSSPFSGETDSGRTAFKRQQAYTMWRKGKRGDLQNNLKRTYYSQWRKGKRAPTFSDRGIPVDAGDPDELYDLDEEEMRGISLQRRGGGYGKLGFKQWRKMG